MIGAKKKKATSGNSTLSNGSLTGFSRSLHRGEHEPILARDLFDAVQARRAANALDPAGPAQGRCHHSDHQLSPQVAQKKIDEFDNSHRVPPCGKINVKVGIAAMSRRLREMRLSRARARVERRGLRYRSRCDQGGRWSLLPIRSSICGGFADQSHFNRRFRQMVGVSPGRSDASLRDTTALRDCCACAGVCSSI